MECPIRQGGFVLKKEQEQLKYYLNKFYHEFYDIRLRIKIFDEIGKVKKFENNQYLVLLQQHEHPRAIILAICRILDGRADCLQKRFIKFLKENNFDEARELKTKFKEWKKNIEPQINYRHKNIAHHDMTTASEKKGYINYEKIEKIINALEKSLNNIKKKYITIDKIKHGGWAARSPHFNNQIINDLKKILD